MESEFDGKTTEELEEIKARLLAENAKLKKHLALLSEAGGKGSELQRINLRESLIESWQGIGLTREQAIIAMRGRDGLQEADENKDAAPSTVADLLSYFNSLKFPAIKQEIYDWAETKKAPDDILKALKKLPEKAYKNINDIALALQV